MRSSSFLKNSLFVCIALLSANACTGTMDSTPGGPDGSNTTTLPDTGPTTDGPIGVGDNYVRWMKCMRLSDFQAANMTTAWNNIRAQNNTRCSTCHETGGEGFIVSQSESRFYEVVSTNKYYALMFFAIKALAPFKVDANDITMLGVSQGQDPHREHPRFDPTPGLAASRDFAARTQARFEANSGNCPPGP